MANDAMQEYPPNQRAAICESQFRNKTRARIPVVTPEEVMVS